MTVHGVTISIFLPSLLFLLTLSLFPIHPWHVWNMHIKRALNQGSLYNPGTTATEAEARKIEKYRELIDNGYIFQPVALEVQGSLGDSSEIFITRLCGTTINEMAAF